MTWTMRTVYLGLETIFSCCTSQLFSHLVQCQEQKYGIMWGGAGLAVFIEGRAFISVSFQKAFEN